jgi:hypothetical protein
MTTVNGKLIGASNPQRVEVTATLVDVTGEPVVGYVAGQQGEIVQPRRITPDTDGDWTVDLVPNASVESPAGDTLWAVMEGRALALPLARTAMPSAKAAHRFRSAACRVFDWRALKRTAMRSGIPCDVLHGRRRMASACMA